MIYQWKKSLILILIFSLSGCTMFSPVKTNNYTSYVLCAVPQGTIKPYHHSTIFISPVDANPSYSSDDMAYIEQPYHIEYFAKNKWLNPPAVMLRPLIVKTLRNTKHYHAVTTSTRLVQYDYMLNSKILELVQVFSCNCSHVRFKLYAEIVDARTGRIIAAKEFAATVDAPPNPYGGVFAANQAVEIVLGQLARFAVNRT